MTNILRSYLYVLLLLLSGKTQKTNLQPNESERIKRVEQQVVALTINVRVIFNTILLCFIKKKTVRRVRYQQTEVRSMLHLV